MPLLPQGQPGPHLLTLLPHWPPPQLLLPRVPRQPPPSAPPPRPPSLLTRPCPHSRPWVHLPRPLHESTGLCRLPSQQSPPPPPRIQVTPSEPQPSVPDTGPLSPASAPQGVKPTPSSSTPLYMVTSFVSAPPAPEPPAPEPPPEPTKVTVRSLSPAKEGPEGTTLRQGPPQKPYTFLEEKAR